MTWRCSAAQFDSMALLCISKRRVASTFLRRAMAPLLPLYRDRHLLSEAVMVMKLVVLNAEFVHQAGDLHIVAAIFGDIEQLAFLKPLNGLQALGGLFHADRRGGDGVEGKPVLQLVLQLDQ